MAARSPRRRGGAIEAARPRYRSSRRPQIAVAVVATLLSVVMAEGVLRLFDVGATVPGSKWFAGGNHPRFLFVPEPETGYALRAGFTGREIAASGEFDVAVSVDRHGLRDHRHTAGSPFVVLALGDSQTFGEGVEVEDAFPAVIERSTGYQVWSAGVPGYDSRKMSGRLEQLLPRARPSLVMMSLSPLWDAQRLEDPFVYREGYIVARRYADRLHLVGDNLWNESIDLPLIGAATAYAKAYSRLARLALPALSSALRSGGERGGPENVDADPDSIDETARLLTRAAASAASNDAAFLAVLLESRGDDHRRAREQLERRLTEAGIGWVALDSLLGAIDWTALRHQKDGHWNRDGHHQVGTALAPLVTACVEARSCAARPAVSQPAPIGSAG